MIETLSHLALQQYWWFIISVLGALLVFLMFVQGGQTLIYSLGKSGVERTMLVNALGRKWEFTFTTLVTFGGAFFAARQGLVNPESFTFIESALILAVVVLGGMGSQLGVILAAILLTALPEVARQFAEYRMLIFGLIMVLMMVWRPQGLLPAQRPQVEIK